MAGLFLVRSQDRDAASAMLETARVQFAQHGFAAPTALRLPGWELLHWTPILGGPESLYEDGDDWIAVAGSLAFDGKIGRPGLEAMLRGTAPPLLDWTRISGQFVAVIKKSGRTFIITDYFSSFQIFHHSDFRVFSTSFLAAAKSLPQLSFDPQGVYEFAFNVIPIGNDTVLSNVSLLGPDYSIELIETGTLRHAMPKPLPNFPLTVPINDRVARHRERLETIVQAQVAHFGERIFCPLSGGLDSRLLLAAFRAAGCSPHVYVYGPPNHADVTIARGIGDSLGFPIDWVDKSTSQEITPECFPAQVERNFQEFDGLPNYGNLFDNGGNAAARDRRHAAGALAASGGCGEIYRDFFFLPDKPFSARTVARIFFARYTREDVTAEFDETAFLDAIGDKILGSLELPRTQRELPRSVIEQIYPRVRCRSLFGREISIEARYGAYFMPFLDHRVVAEAMTLPMELKHAGRFEAMLLHAIDPELSRQPSAYGHDFSAAPSQRHQFDEWSSRVRPAWLRQRSYAIRRRLRPLGDEHGGLLTPDYMGRVLDLDFPAMRRFFRIDRITDSGLWRRIACLEYLAAHLGSRLTG